MKPNDAERAVAADKVRQALTSHGSSSFDQLAALTGLAVTELSDGVLTLVLTGGAVVTKNGTVTIYGIAAPDG